MHKLVLRRLRIHSTARVEILKINRHERKPFSYVACSAMADAQNQRKKLFSKSHMEKRTKTESSQVTCPLESKKKLEEKCLSGFFGQMHSKSLVVCETLVLRLHRWKWKLPLQFWVLLRHLRAPCTLSPPLLKTCDLSSLVVMKRCLMQQRESRSTCIYTPKNKGKKVHIP